MFRPKEYSEAERRLAGLARKIAINRDVLYHGTRYAHSILRMGVLFKAGYTMVSFTRSPEEAAYWALLDRDNDEGRGAIFIFDRRSLHCRYKIEPYHDGCRNDDTTCRDEAEEAIRDNVIDIGKYLIGFVSDKTTRCSNKLKKLNREYRVEMEARLRQLAITDELPKPIPASACPARFPAESGRRMVKSQKSAARLGLWFSRMKL